MRLNNYLKETSLKDLIAIGFDKKKISNPAVMKKVIKVMNKALELGLILPIDDEKMRYRPLKNMTDKDIIDALKREGFKS